MASPSKRNKTGENQNSTAINTKGSWVSDRAWISGLTGALAVVTIAAWYSSANILNKGLSVFGYPLTHQHNDTVLAALIMVCLSMVAVETIRLWRWHRMAFFNVHPKLRSAHHWRFVVECVKHYLLYLCLLYLVIAFYQTAGEYGFKRSAPYYQNWFRFLDIAWAGYLWLGLPYVLLTRAVKYSPDCDRRDLACFFEKLLLYPISRLTPRNKQHQGFDEKDKKMTRALLVKLFFTPLMTVFFLDQFPHLINNLTYVVNDLGTLIINGHYNHTAFNRDFFNITIALIFSIDVALAWCGYTVSSRWVDNQTFSAEPSILGWLVCLICYPPFQSILGIYYAAPAEREILQLTNQWVVSLFTGMMVMSYVVYMLATLWFGVRFSNLTHRGIIRTGPYSFVRHPAYAAKNFSWWCVMFPIILYNAAHNGTLLACTQILGLGLMSWVYYLRATTEERHLGSDPRYQEYCEKVGYRFIPGVF
ncbi:MAG: hypothetical protein JKY66_06610 [Spongiibacteraceae bacterium]|nr:hypothetical protein [Spongiibacteraceae bacterium]